MDFKNKIVIVTGGAQGIGRCIAEEFEKLGATVCVIDKQQGDHFVGDLTEYHGDNGWTLKQNRQ